MLTFFTDTDCDFTPEMCKEYGIKLLTMPYSIDGVEYFPYTENSHSIDDFYNLLRKGALPVTAALAPQTYMDAFEEEFKKGNDVLYVHFSEAMSGTFNSMRIALEELKEKYPDRKFYQFDTKGITILSRALTMEAVKLYKNGSSAEEILDFLNKEVMHYAVYFFADNLKFFAKSGRVSNITAKMGAILHIKPIISMGANGKMESIDKAMGRKAAVSKLINYVQKLGDDVPNHILYVANTGNLELCNTVIEELKKLYGEDLKVEIIDINPTIGSHCGPDCTGICFHSISR